MHFEGIRSTIQTDPGNAVKPRFRALHCQLEKGLPPAINELTDRIIGCAFKVPSELGGGFLEKVCGNAPFLELEDAGLHVHWQKPISVYHGGRLAGDFCADLLVESRVIVEVRAVRAIVQEHEEQLVNHLTAGPIAGGQVINFGPPVEIKRKNRICQKRPDKH